MNAPKRNPQVAWQKVDGLIVMVELNEKRLFHKMNPVGSLIWELCDGDHNTDSITKKIADEFDVSADQAKNDVTIFLEQLKNMNLLESL